MRAVAITISILLLISLSVPARADFRYTDTTKITGGVMVGMAKFASALGKASGQDAQDALKPVTVTHYVKGNKLRTENADGTIQIIDLDGRRMIGIDPQKKTYGVVTFDELKATIEQQKQKMQEALQQAAQQNGQKQNPQVTLTPAIKVLPGSNTRLILGQATVETKIQMDMQMQAQGAGMAPTPAPGQPAGPNSATISMTFDIWAAPALTGYQEFSQFYRRMAQEVNWVPPSNIHMDPRMSQGMAELQKNGTALKGLPMLTLVSMAMPLLPGQPPPNTAQNSPGALPPRPGPGSSNADSPTGAVLKGLGGLFGKKKQNNPSAPPTLGAPGGQPNSNSLMDMTMEVTSFSGETLDGSLFDVPAGYTKVQLNPDQMMNAKRKQ
ncbi:MAG TPA: hypothetical protein VEU31_04645 [Candidatus Acidoferrales bacterium]|nr:hypothetical protein [Candidatus Acidoferrales bacterium]